MKLLIALVALLSLTACATPQRPKNAAPGYFTGEAMKRPMKVGGRYRPAV
ncbi:MAG TPA: hypothetical protein VM598_11195 [Bdellovibrionota bacterium]|nr:hypothetical protein [Bdellovibrionota bacterium]